MTRFGADALVLALGFDAHANDPIGILRVTTEGFGMIAARVAALRLPTAIVQEGGYGLPVIGGCLRAFLAGFGVRTQDPPAATQTPSN